MQPENFAVIDPTPKDFNDGSLETGIKFQRGVIFSMSSSDGGLLIKDDGGTRSGNDRRKLLIITRNPERRIIKDRRSGPDRRSELKCGNCLAIERRDASI